MRKYDSIMIFLLVVAVAVSIALLGTVDLGADDHDWNCNEFRSQKKAQEFFDKNDPDNDPYGLDGPKGPSYSGERNKACELLR